MNTEQLEKYLAGDASQPEKESVQQWMETDEKHRTEFAALRTLYDISLAHLSEDEPVRQAARPFAEWLKVAAAILITFVCSHYFFNPASAMDEAALQTLYIPAGQRAELSLADGTKVWLNSLTTFTFPDHFTDTSREVFLDGEAYFVVAHDGAKLFSIHTPVYDVQVLGTEFNVSAYGKEQGTFETSLINGAVEVISPANAQSFKLLPGTRIHEAGGRLTVDSIPDYNHFLWRKGIICFENERVGDILAQLKLYYDIDIRSENASINNMRYTGKFRTKDGIEHVLNVLKIPTGLRYHRDIDANFILIK